MEKIPQKPVEKFSSNPTITEISSAIAALFDGHDITSEKIISSIEDVYALINNICTELPQHLKTQLLLWPNSESDIHYFIENLKQEYPYDKDFIIDDILDSYLDFFERWGEWALIHRRKIVSNYNPERIINLTKEQRIKLKNN